VLCEIEPAEVERHARLLADETDLGIEVARRDVGGLRLGPASPGVLEPRERVMGGRATDDAAALVRELERPLDERLCRLELEPQQVAVRERLDGHRLVVLASGVARDGERLLRPALEATRVAEPGRDLAARPQRVEAGEVAGLEDVEGALDEVTRLRGVGILDQRDVGERGQRAALELRLAAGGGL